MSKMKDKAIDIANNIPPHKIAMICICGCIAFFKYDNNDEHCYCCKCQTKYPSHG